jgi:hypothetical protein
MTPPNPPCIYPIYKTGMKRKLVKLPQKVSAGKRTLSIIHVPCRLCTVGAQSIACAQSIAHSYIGDSICKKKLKF